jgi:hypothetical protein
VEGISFGNQNFENNFNTVLNKIDEQYKDMDLTKKNTNSIQTKKMIKEMILHLLNSSQSLEIFSNIMKNDNYPDKDAIFDSKKELANAQYIFQNEDAVQNNSVMNNDIKKGGGITKKKNLIMQQRQRKTKNRKHNFPR